MSSSSDISQERMPSLYLPHGGGPCFFMDWPGDPHLWDQMAVFLRGLGKTLPRPKAIVVISAHWEAQEFTVTTSSQPSLLFDYYGFPAHTYQLKYPAAGSPELATRIMQLLEAKDLPAAADPIRGLDHGVFIPLLLVYPEADIPIVQLSLKVGLDPASHIKAGQALSALRDEGVLFIGSGMSFHNMQGFFRGGFDHPSRQFDQWLSATVAQTEDRNGLLRAWSDAPGALACHPRAEHLLPLMVIAGTASEQAGQKIFECDIKGATISAFSFGHI